MQIRVSDVVAIVAALLVAAVVLQPGKVGRMAAHWSDTFADAYVLERIKINAGLK